MLKKVRKIIMTTVAILFSNSISVFATSNANMVWEKPANEISQSIRGPVAMTVATVIIVVAGLSWGLTEGGNMANKAIRMVIALAIVGGVLVLVTNVFNISSGFTIL